MNADGSNVRQLAPDGYSWNGIDWSPDGKWLAVTRVSFQLTLIDARTGAQGTTFNQSKIAYLADFSPDGSKVAYSIEHEGDVDLFVSNVDGSNTRRLTAPIGLARSYHAGPRWSPDGTLLAYWTFVFDPLESRSVPGVQLVSSNDGSPVPWKNGALVFGDQPIWRTAPR